MSSAFSLFSVVTVIAFSRTSEARLCVGNKSLTHEYKTSPTGLNISSTPAIENGENEEWIFRTDDDFQFINVKFLNVSFAGDDCNQSGQPG